MILNNLVIIVTMGGRILFGSLLILAVCFGQLTYPDVENPHGTDKCLACHFDQGKPGRDNFNPAACDACHSRESVNSDIHQLNNIDIHTDGIAIPQDFIRTDTNGNFSCSTCHSEACKTDRSNRKFLRGGPYSSDLDFCFTCHQRQAYKQFNPHRQIRENGSLDESTCLHCHAQVPDSKADAATNNTMHLEMTPTCNKCHALHEHEDQHLGRSIVTSGNLIQDRLRKIEQQFEMKFPLSENLEIRCNTCHYTHQRGVLKQESVILAGPGDNQWFLRLPRKQLCFACHSL